MFLRAEILSKLQTKGVVIDYCTLHVTYNTFKPITVDNYNDHQIGTEICVEWANAAESTHLLSPRFIGQVVGDAERFWANTYACVFHWGVERWVAHPQPVPCDAVLRHLGEAAIGIPDSAVDGVQL